VRGRGTTDCYPEVEQFIVFLRNPFDHFVSQWRCLQYQASVSWAVPNSVQSHLPRGDRHFRAESAYPVPFLELRFRHC
jgi:hypothetical protein